MIGYILFGLMFLFIGLAIGCNHGENEKSEEFAWLMWNDGKCQFTGKLWELGSIPSRDGWSAVNLMVLTSENIQITLDTHGTKIIKEEVEKLKAHNELCVKAGERFERTCHPFIDPNQPEKYKRRSKKK